MKKVVKWTKDKEDTTNMFLYIFSFWIGAIVFVFLWGTLTVERALALIMAMALAIIFHIWINYTREVKYVK